MSLRGAIGRRAQPYTPPFPIIQHWNHSPAALMKAGKQIQATLSSRQPFCKYHSRMNRFETQAGLGRKGLGVFMDPERGPAKSRMTKCAIRGGGSSFARRCTGGLLLGDLSKPYGHFSWLANTSYEQQGQRPRGPNGCAQTQPECWETAVKRWQTWYMRRGCWEGMRWTIC